MERYLVRCFSCLSQVSIRKATSQIPTFTNDTNLTANISSDAKLSSLDKIIISMSCGIFMGLAVLFFWNLCEIRHYVATQHRLLLRNNTIGSFPQHSPYDLNESTTSNNDDLVGHYTNTSAVTSSSSSNENGKHETSDPKDTKTEPVQFFHSNGKFGSPQASSSEFPFLYADSPDFNKLEEPPNTDTIVPSSIQEEMRKDHTGTSDVDDPESFDTDSVMFTNSQYFQHDTMLPIADSICGDNTAVAAYDSGDNVNIPDEECSIPSVGAAFDVSSIGNVSLEQSMASSRMK